jgi:hypothetical protein
LGPPFIVYSNSGLSLCVNNQSFCGSHYLAAGKSQPFQAPQDEKSGNGVNVRQKQGKIFQGEFSDGVQGRPHPAPPLSSRYGS